MSLKVRSLLLVPLALVALVSLVVPAAAGAQHAAHAAQAPASLVKTVREVTRPFLDIAAAGPAGYGPFLGCVSAPEIGAMGQAVHRAEEEAVAA